MDQARNILNSYIPATQWAMNYLNNNITQPIQQGAKDFQTGFNGQPGQYVNGNAMQSLGDSVANATPTGQEVHAMPLALGLVGKSANSFGSALRNAGKALPGYKYDVAPKVIDSIGPAIERLLMHDPTDANYVINQHPKDAAAIGNIAEHYMPGVTKYHNGDPTKIAQALLSRIFEQKQGLYDNPINTALSQIGNKGGEAISSAQQNIPQKPQSMLDIFNEARDYVNNQPTKKPGNPYANDGHNLPWPRK